MKHQHYRFEVRDGEPVVIFKTTGQVIPGEDFLAGGYCHRLQNEFRIFAYEVRREGRNRFMTQSVSGTPRE